MAQSSIEWKNTLSNIHRKATKQNPIEVDDHPLRRQVITVIDRIPRKILGSQPSTGRTTPVSTPASILEPLGSLEGLIQFAALEEMDPLTKMAAEMEIQEVAHSNSNKKCKGHKMAMDIEPWGSRKHGILSKFTTSEKISIITSFLGEGEKVVVKAQSTAVDKVQHRLEQLDYFEEGSQRKLDLSQGEYISRIELLNKELVAAWNTEQRVKALKIAIQCAKLLSDTDVLRFYPSKFVLITDILDIFGQLVYDRLRTKADYIKPGSKAPAALPEDFTPDIVPETAKETCRNWFFKIASIRELVPRLYVEMALLKSYSFLSTNEYSDALLRLTQMINGIGNPLVAVYARCYLCRVGITISSHNPDRTFLIQNFTNFLDCYHHLFSRCVKVEIEMQNMEMSTYMTLFTPALDFILQAVAYGASESLFADLLEKCYKHGNSSLILNTIMAAFRPNFVATRTLQFLELINNTQKDDLPKYLLLRTLGLCISVCPPPAEQRRQVLGLVWRYISSLNIPEQYISCAEVWVQFTVQHFMIREVNAVLGDIIDHMAIDRAYEQHYNQLKIIVDTVVSYVHDFEALLAIDNFLPLVDLFKQETVKVEVCKNILTSCGNDQQTCDPVVVNALMFLCSVLHDSVNALTVDDERRQIGEILCNIIRRVNYGNDFEQQLTFYVEARAAFSNIDMVLYQLVQCVNTLSVKTKQMVKGHHTRKTADFVRACAAYCFITIPSIASVHSQLELYLLSGRVALFNHCLGQADACFKSILQIITDMEKETNQNESFLLSYIKSFLSMLLVIPDSPDRGVLSLIRHLLNTLQNFQWMQQNGTLANLYLNVLDMLHVMGQEIYPYHVDKVESNDTMYGSDVKFLNELNKMCSLILRETLGHLKQMGPGRNQANLALELLVRVALRADIREESLQTLVLNLWQLCLKHGYADMRYVKSTRNYLKSRSVSMNSEALQEVIKNLVISE